MMVMSEEPAEAPTMMAAAWVMDTADDCARLTSRSASVCARELFHVQIHGGIQEIQVQTYPGHSSLRQRSPNLGHGIPTSQRQHT